jgi:cell wall-associated NlpC family hydrolase
MSWIYRLGLAQSEVTEDSLIKAGLKYELVEVESALRAHINEALDKPYKFYTSMREDAPNFFSCSSLVSYLYIFAGIWMPSVVIDKYFFAKPVTKEDLRFGDLIFLSSKIDPTHPQRITSLEFEPGQHTSPKPVTHVMMYLGEEEFIHASPMSQKGKVVIEKLEGILQENIIGYGRVADDLKEKRFVVEIPQDKSEWRVKENLLNSLK